MNDDADRIRRQMQSIRREVSDDVEGIVHSAHTLSDWKYYVRMYPWLFVGGAIALGFVAAPRRRGAVPDLTSLSAKDLRALLARASLTAAPSAVAGPSGNVARALQLAAPWAARTLAKVIASRLAGQATGHGAGAHPMGDE